VNQAPRLSFFCELHDHAVEKLFADQSVIEQLQGLNATLSLGILDFSHERATVVQRLNRAGIPVVAWLLLPRDQGYWFNVSNAPQARSRYMEFQAWTDSLNLKWDGIGLDIEADIHELEQFMLSKWRLPYTIFKRGCGRKQLQVAQDLYQSLVHTIQSDGYRVDSYDFPFIVDEKRAGSRVIRSLTGTLDITSNRRVLMLYSSLFRPVGIGVLWNYAKETSATAVGITGGGVKVPGFNPPPPLTWEELARDLRIARRWNSDLHIFSLEGCVERGYLAQLKDFDWNEEPPPQPQLWASIVAIFRPLMVFMLWCSAHLGGIALLLIAVLLVLLK